MCGRTKLRLLKPWPYICVKRYIKRDVSHGGERLQFEQTRSLHGMERKRGMEATS